MIGAAAVVAACAALACAAWAVACRRREQAATVALQRQTAAADELAALLSAGPHFWHFTAAGERGSPDLGTWLGLAAPPRQFADLLQGSAESDRAAVLQRLAAWSADGQGFTCRIAVADGRTLELTAPPRPAVPVVWLRDVSEAQRAAAELERRCRLAEATAGAFGEVLDGVDLALWRRDDRFELAWCSPAYAAMVEATPDEVVASRLEFTSVADPAQARRLAEKARRSRAAQSERRHFVVAGDRRTLRITERPLAAGGTVGWAYDITDLEQAEADLASHIEAHAEVLQNLSTAIGIFGPDKRLLLFNRAFARLWRLDEDWLGQQPTFGELLEMLREHRRLPEQVDWQAYKRERLSLFTTVIEPREELMHLPDERTLRLVITPHPFGGLLLTFEDVTDQLVLERARNTLIAVQRATLDNLYEGVAVYGGDGRLRLWNKAFADIWELSETLLDGDPHITQVIESERRLLAAGDDDWEQLTRSLTAPFNERSAQHGRINRLDGQVIDFASVPLPDGNVLFTYLDITDSTRIERALRDRNEALQAADQLKSEFIANVSYELRTPLNTIIGFAEIIANQYFGNLNPRQMEYAEGILDSSHHLMLLVNDILDLATIEAGHMVLELEPFDLHATLSAILGLTRERARRQNLTIELECPAGIGWYEADERRIKQVLFNLMSNAMKFTPAGGVITLGAQRTGEEVLLWVADNGIGIPEAEQSQVFDKFYKRNNGGRQPGAGLGLSLVRSFIELHGGRVDLHSAPERGTTVTCHLPLVPQIVAGSEAAAAAGGG